MGVRVFDFRCRNDHVVEHFVDAGIEEVECHCGAMGKRQVAAPRSKLEPFTGAFPGAADKWERNRESKMRQERKNLENHGTYK